MPDIPTILVIAVLAAVVAVYAWYVSTVIRKKPVTGVESLIGAQGVVHSDSLSPEGEVIVNAVIWRARLRDFNLGGLKKGDSVTVRSVQELTLIVDPVALKKREEQKQ